MEKTYEENTSVFEESFDEERFCIISKMVIDYPIQRIVSLSREHFKDLKKMI